MGIDLSVIWMVLIFFGVMMEERDLLVTLGGA